MNKSLYNNIIILPQSLVDHLDTCFNQVSGDQNTEGWKRNQELRQNKQITYQNLKRIKNWFDGYSGKKEDAPFILNGGDRMNTWVNHALQQMRSSISSSKKHRSNGGMQNQYLDNHEKNNINLTDTHTTTADDLKLENEIKRINKLIKII
jgi:hypothetical protein